MQPKDSDIFGDQTQKLCNANKSYPERNDALFIDDKKKLKSFKYGATNNSCALSCRGCDYHVSNILPIQIIIIF